MRLRTRRSLTIPTIGPRRERLRHARSVSGDGVELHGPRKDGVLLFFKRLCARIYDKTTTRPRIDSYFGIDSTFGALFFPVHLSSFPSLESGWGVSVMSNGRVRSDRHDCYGSGSGSQGVEPRHVTHMQRCAARVRALARCKTSKASKRGLSARHRHHRTTTNSDLWPYRPTARRTGSMTKSRR